MIAIPKNLPLKWRKEHWDRDIVAIWVGEGADEVLLINIYNTNPDRDRSGPLRSGKALELITQHPDKWVMAGDFNARHPDWDTSSKEANSGDTIRILNRGVCYACRSCRRITR
jgi:hypothetical protein